MLQIDLIYCFSLSGSLSLGALLNVYECAHKSYIHTHTHRTVLLFFISICLCSVCVRHQEFWKVRQKLNGVNRLDWNVYTSALSVRYKWRYCVCVCVCLLLIYPFFCSARIKRFVDFFSVCVFCRWYNHIVSRGTIFRRHNFCIHKYVLCIPHSLCVNSNYILDNVVILFAFVCHLYFGFCLFLSFSFE